MGRDRVVFTIIVNLRSQKYRTSPLTWFERIIIYYHRFIFNNQIVFLHFIVYFARIIINHIDLWQKLNYKSSSYVHVRISETLSFYNSYTVHLYINMVYFLNIFPTGVGTSISIETTDKSLRLLCPYQTGLRIFYFVTKRQITSSVGFTKKLDFKSNGRYSRYIKLVYAYSQFIVFRIIYIYIM